MFKKISAVLLLLLLPVLIFAKTINIYHTSDTHGFYFPREINGKNIGGFAALAKLLSEDKTPYLLLDSGDWTSGTAEAKDTKGNLSVQFMNKLGYHATTIGNHELDFKEPAFLKNLASIDFDVLAANIYDTHLKSYPEHVKPFKTYMVDGKKIAVIGLAKDFGSNQKRFRISKDKKVLKKALRDLEKQNPDLIILIDHNSTNDEKHSDPRSPAILLKNIKGVDLVLGGHAHIIVQNLREGGRVFVESGASLEGVSKITVDFDEVTGKLKDITSEYILLDIAKIGQDPYIKEFAEANRNKDLDVLISHANETILKYLPAGSKSIDSPLANIFADLLKEYGGAEIGLQNTGALRKDLPKGPITKRAVLEIFPFPNKVTVVNVNGNFIKKLVRDSLKGDKSLYQYSGMEVKYKMNGKKKPQELEITVNGKPIEGEKMYSVATLDYIAMGNSEGYMFKKVTDKKSVGDKQGNELFIDYLRKNPKGINGAKTGRITKE